MLDFQLDVNTREDGKHINNIPIPVDIEYFI